MSARRNKTVQTSPAPAARARLTWTSLAAAFVAAFFIYGPALTGPFVYDDDVQRYAKPVEIREPFLRWIGGLRPMLFFSFWVNHEMLGDRPLGYHVVNVIIHVLNSALVFLVTRRLLDLYRNSATPARKNLLAGFTAAVFLLHPIQTESVAYIVSRSESLSAFFMLAALALFLYRLPGTVTWRTAVSLLLLTVAACATKEHAVILVPLLLLADWYWNVDFSVSRLRRNWRFYVPAGIAAIFAAAAAFRIVGQSLAAGFHLQEFNWIEYFYTECRVFFSYIRLLLLPVGQTVAADVPISRHIGDDGAIFGLLGILALIAAAFYFRRRFRLASFGILVFIVLLAPTSSFVPLLEPQVEHRLYLATLALTLVIVEFLLNARIPQRYLASACICICLVFGALSYSRNQLWADEALLWKDAVSKSPNLSAPYYNVAVAYLNRHRCQEAEAFLETATARFDREAPMWTLFGRAEECLSKFDEAVRILTRAAQLEPRASLYTRIGIIRARQGNTPAAYAAFDRAIELDASFPLAYVLRGELYEAAERLDPAASDFRHALALAPDNELARKHLDRVEQRLHLSGAARPEGESP